jgi:hypothetical protein
MGTESGGSSADWLLTGIVDATAIKSVSQAQNKRRMLALQLSPTFASIAQIVAPM